MLEKLQPLALRVEEPDIFYSGQLDTPRTRTTPF